MPPVLFTGATIGQTADATAYTANFTLLEASLFDLGPSIISGLALSIGTGLSVNVTAGVASIGGQVNKAAGFVIGSLTPSTTNDLYLLQAGAGTSLPSPSTPPANSVKLGTCVTGVGTVTSVDMSHASGRQAKQRTENLIMGGGAGHPRSVNLAAWAAAAADGVEVYGTLPRGAGGAAATSSTAYGSEPGSPMTGDLDFYTDGASVVRWNGSAWQPWGPLNALTRTPAAGSLTAINVTTAAISDSQGGLWINAPTLGSTHLQGWVKALAAGAYTWTVRMSPLLLSSTFSAAGLMLRDSAGGKIITFEQYAAGDTGIDIVPWTDANTRGANVLNINTLGQVFPWLKIHDDGTTNRTYSISADGLNWIDLYTEARTTFLGVAPNQAGLFACANGAATGVTVSSWAGL